MSTIDRNFGDASRQRFDLAIVGGGIHGAMVALESVRRGLRPILLERADFAGATTHNSLRIVHGGLRYLQSADLPRFQESVSERRWLLRHFPDLVRPLACVMPLDGIGPRRAWLLGPALWLNDLLSAGRNRGLAPHCRLPRGGLIRTSSLGVSWLDRQGGLSARWYDAFAPDISRLVIETLRWACAHGALALNYTEVDSLLLDHSDSRASKVAGVRAHDRLGGECLEIRAPVVINAAGPWSRAFAGLAAPERPDLFVPSLAWNVLFDRPAIPGVALALAPPDPGAQVYFSVPWKGRLLVGTGHAPWVGPSDHPTPSADQMDAFIADLNHALPHLDLAPRDVLRIHAGLLPCRRPGSTELTSREVLVDHSQDGGPSGFFSLSGIKFTTARRVADKALRLALPQALPRRYEALARPARVDLADPDWDWLPKPEDDRWLEALRPLVAKESVLHLDDLMLRRTRLADNPRRARELAHRACALFEWDAERRGTEVERVYAALQKGSAMEFEVASDAERSPV